MPGVKVLEEMRHELERVISGRVGHAEGLPENDECEEIVLVSPLSCDRLAVGPGVNLRESVDEGGPSACSRRVQIRSPLEPLLVFRQRLPVRDHPLVLSASR